MSDREVDDLVDRHTLRVPPQAFRGRSFLLGDRSGFVLYLPLAGNERDATFQGSKWYGASGIGQSFLEDLVTWVEVDGRPIVLDRANQTEFIMHLDEAVRLFGVEGREVQERYFVPNGTEAVMMTLGGDDFTCGVRPELDMRYYQSFNSDFSSYDYEVHEDYVVIRNSVTDAGPLHEQMDFCAVMGTLAESEIEIVPADKRFVRKTYPKDEAREKAIESVYAETGQRVPDEAPIWNLYSTQVYSPVRIRSHGPMTLVCAFGAVEANVRARFDQVKANLPTMRATKRTVIAGNLTDGAVETGNQDVDDAYAHVLTRFNDCLVARDADVHVSGRQRHHYFAIFAGNKYFMDAWKRDENIALRALLATNDYESVRAILDTTWQFQDQRTGRLPHIIRTGEPLVYYSSDGTLWALHRLFQYTHQSGDMTLLEGKLPMVQHFFSASMAFVQHGLLPSGGIIDPQYLWETWEDTPFTPRAGYPVEIELLWLTVLAEFAPLINDETLAQQMRAALASGQGTFEQFYGAGYLFDSLGYDWSPNRTLTPNGYIAFDLQYPLPPELKVAMIAPARDQLAGRRGVRSLAPRDWPAVFPKAFLDDPRSHTGKNMASFGIFNYHRGIEWEWLNSSFVAGELSCGDAHHAWSDYTSGQVDEALHDAGIGGLSELYDEHGQLGADFQAWSMAALIDTLHLYAGITVDAAAQVIQVAPWIPPELPHLSVRSRIGDLRFDLLYEPTDRGHHHLRVRPVQKPDDAYSVEVSIRLPEGARVGEAGSNGRVIHPADWSYATGPAQERTTVARLMLPLGDGIDLRLIAGK